MKLSTRTYATIAALGGLIFGYDTGVISGALLFIGPQFAMSPLEEGWVTSSLLIGAAIGALSGARIANRWGRRGTILAAGVVFILSAIGCALAGGVGMLALFRGLSGLGIGAASIVVPMYVSEMAPPRVRGRMVSINSLMIVVGQLIAYLVNSSLASSGQWRWMLGLAAVPALMLVIGMFFVPESPVYLARQAGEVNEDTSITTERQFLRDPRLRTAVLIACGVGVVQQITGVNAIIYFAPTMMSRVGLPTDNAVHTAIAIGVVSVIACAVGLWIVDKIGRRRLLTAGLIGTSSSLLILAPVYSRADESFTIAMLSLGLMVVFIAFQQAAVSLTTWLLMSELVPLEVRGLGMGLAGLCLWTANFIVALSFLPLVEAIGGPAAFVAFAVLGAVALGFVRRYVPETTGRALGDMPTQMAH